MTFKSSPVRSQMVLTNINATRSHSLRSAGEDFLIPSSVAKLAKHIIKPAELNHAQTPFNRNVEKTRSMEAS
jgi:hypothetical protein